MTDALLADAIAHAAPYSHATSEAALGAETCAALARLFDEDVPWARHDTSFYACVLAVVTDRIDPRLLRALPLTVGKLLGVPLTHDVHVTVQRMDPGDHALTHTDRPQVGYESARLIVHLNRTWSAADGGLLEVRAVDDGPVLATYAPCYDHAFAFVMSARSHHAVTPAQRPRRSVVFNFWHAANTQQVADHVAATFDGLRFDALPAALDPILLAAEAELPEHVTHVAGLTALVLARWGYAADTLVRAYERCLERSPSVVWALHAGQEEDLALTLAAWLCELHVDAFDPDRWATLEAALRPFDAPRYPRLAATWNRCVPRQGEATATPGKQTR